MKGLVILLTFKAYLENSYLKEFRGQILEKSFRNERYYLRLDKTIFYPHLSGGQPKDKGKINDLEVIDVYEDGDHIIHVLGENIATDKVHMVIDWDNRFDIMQQHTGQHLLSYSFHTLFDSQTLSFHLGDSYATIDIEKMDLNEDEVRQIEFLTNKIIQSNFHISSYIEKDSDDLRVVEIDGLHSSHCSGTHVSTTGEVGLVKIRRWDRYKGNIRVEFLCGFRALKDYSWKNEYIKEIGSLLSSKDIDVLDSTRFLMDQKSSLELENKNLRKEIYELKGEAYLQEARSYHGISYIVKEFQDISLKELGNIASYLSQKEKTIQIYSISNGETGQFLVSRSKDLDINLREVFNKISQSIILKGGGSPQLVQGGSSLVLLDNIIRSFYSEIRDYYKS